MRHTCDGQAGKQTLTHTETVKQTNKPIQTESDPDPDPRDPCRG